MKLTRLPPDRNPLSRQQRPYFIPSFPIPLSQRLPKQPNFHTRLLRDIVLEMPLPTHALPKRMWEEMVIPYFVWAREERVVQGGARGHTACGLGLEELFEEGEGGFDGGGVRFGGRR